MIFDENEFFRQATMRICSSLDIETVLLRCQQYLSYAIPVDWIGFYVYERGLGTIRTVAITNNCGEVDCRGVKTGSIIPVPPEARSLFENPEHPAVRIVNHADLDPIFRPFYQYYDVTESSVLILWLVVEGKYLGTLALVAEGKNRYSEEHARLLSLLREPFTIALANFLKHEEVLKLKDILADDNRFLRTELQRFSGEDIIGGDFGLRGVMEMVRQVAPLDSPVLLLGESGVGKDLIANTIHNLSSRRENPFIIVNSGAIPETLLDSELFGHEKGSFTGALSQKRGRFERANHGTIFLDEIGELPPQAQVRMLRVLQNKEIERVGGSESITVDIRVIAATHRNLEEMVKTGKFREDLWFRLNVFPIVIPPLRERKADIPVLVHFFIEKKSREMRLPSIPKVTPGAIDRLTAYHWPGNVRELQNVVEHALILNQAGPLNFDRFLTIQQGVETQPGLIPEDGPFTLDEVMSKHIQRVLGIAKGKVHGSGGAAELLGINPSTLRNRMNQLGIPYGRRRQ
jgi:transcriptional regulator with GAF, ATPase, and Fis domain